MTRPSVTVKKYILVCSYLGSKILGLQNSSVYPQCGRHKNCVDPQTLLQEMRRPKFKRVDFYCVMLYIYRNPRIKITDMHNMSNQGADLDRIGRSLTRVWEQFPAASKEHHSILPLGNRTTLRNQLTVKSFQLIGFYFIFLQNKPPQGFILRKIINPLKWPIHCISWKHCAAKHFDE